MSRLVWQQLQIIRLVIKRIAISMMDHFARFKIATYHFFHDEPMRLYPTSLARMGVCWRVSFITIPSFLQATAPIIMLIAAGGALLHGNRQITPIQSPFNEAVVEGPVRNAKNLRSLFNRIFLRISQIKDLLLINMNSVLTTTGHDITSLENGDPRRLAVLLSGQHAINPWGPCKKKPPYCVSPSRRRYSSMKVHLSQAWE